MTSRSNSILSWKIILFLVLMVIPWQSNLNAQAFSWRLKTKAEYLIGQGRMYEALPYLEKYCIRKPKDIATAYFLANQYESIRDYQRAGDWYLKVYEADSVEYIESLFSYGQMLKMSGATESALRTFLRFQSVYKGRETSRELRWLLDQEIKGALMADSLDAHPKDIVLVLLDSTINKIDSEFAPLMLNDSTLLYAGMRNSEPVFVNQELPSKQFHLAKKRDYRWVYDQVWDVPFNQEDGIVGNGALSPDKQRFYFTRCIRDLNQKVNCQLYVSHFKEGKWTEGERLPEPINSPTYTSTHPAIGRDPRSTSREILYFISDRPDGEGGLDIWYTQYNHRTGEYSDIRNAGKQINTPADEFSLSYDLAGSKLYFASKGWAGLGGFDLFRSSGNKRSWTEPENLGKPFNSYADDLYFAHGTNRREGFFVSNRTGGINYQDFSCCDDLYNFRWKKYIDIVFRGSIAQRSLESKKGLMPELDNPQVLLYVFDKRTNERVLLSRDSLLTQDFQLHLEPEELYEIVVESDNYESKSFSLSTRDYVLSDTLAIHFDLDLKPEKPVVLDNIYFEYDRFDLLPEVKTVLDTGLIPFLRAKPTLRIELSAHTDNTGKPAYNRELSFQRAESVKNYLIEQGIEAHRMVAKGYGEKQPIAPNQHPDGSDNPEGRAQNRRVEFKILKD